jgi:hypothetical protein
MWNFKKSNYLAICRKYLRKEEKGKRGKMEKNKAIESLWFSLSPFFPFSIPYTLLKTAK